MLLLLFSLLATPAPPEPSFPAFMAKGECLWEAAPDSYRAAVAAATLAPELDRSPHPPLDEAEWKRMTLACNLLDEQSEYVGELIFAPYTVMRGLEPRLETRWPRASLRGAFNHFSDDEIGLLWAYAMGGGKQWPEHRKALARAAQVKLYQPFGETAWPEGQSSDLDFYLACQLLIAVHAMDVRANVAEGDASQ